LHDGRTSFAGQRADLLIEYQPVQSEHRDRLLRSSLLARNDAQYRRAAVNLASMALRAFRAADRIRQSTTFSRLTALLDAIGDAPMDIDDATSDALIYFPGGPVRPEQIPVAA